ncbi:MAG: HNH/ENDO VII family nuclease [Anaerofustis sp.]
MNGKQSRNKICFSAPSGAFFVGFIAEFNAAVSTATEKAFGIFGKETKGFNLTKEFKETFSGAIGKVLKNETASSAVTAFLSNGTGEFVEELTEQLVNPIVENISFDGEAYTFASNPIGLTADDLYAAMIGFWTGGIIGGGSDIAIDVNTTARLNTMMGNVRQNGESMGVSDRSIRLAQDLTLLTNQDVSFTQGQTQVNADGSIAINKDSATPMQDVVAQMREKGLLSIETKGKTQNRSTQVTTYTYEQLKNMSGAQVKAAYGEMVSKYAEYLKKFGFTDAQVKGYVHEALKTKTAENRISSVMRLQEEMGMTGDSLSESNALQGDGEVTYDDHQQNVVNSENLNDIDENDKIVQTIEQYEKQSEIAAVEGYQVKPNHYSKVYYEGTVKVDGEVRDVSRKVIQRSDIDFSYVDPVVGVSNLELMKKGNSPIGPDGKYINLHHLIQKEVGPMLEMIETTHSQYNKQLHRLVGNKQSFRNDPVLYKQYRNFKKQYWKWRAAEYEKYAGGNNSEN